ncbi:nucleotide-binding universal stress UspA family protein [Streptosporangium becharense]|uniref:Nucleotide-binding universal stress UspA family protein n=1 Tax=Streptosporangium becharense TaxID=1816182 RepID=A0A7W9IC66_9ACTN|nr:universal stress protein [Streptosporangium becharense]MBB2910814.1 nucleotide-binding universal stress UspA family protein [Streptosporangium becharense]MBB5817509.1 nucleotide-binding universal stress UspA family protein [Streptosporangium becharense]
MIVVGVDGSPAGLAAAGWAAREAGVRGTSLRVVHVMPAWPLETPEDGRYASVAKWMRDGATSMVTDALERARRENPRVEAESRLLPGDPRSALIEAAGDAELLVVGSHGLGGFRGMLLGSVALGVSGQARCPVVVVRDVPERPDGEVVVGVDGSPAGADALAFAFAEASLRGTGLRAIHAWERPGVGGPLPPPPVGETAEEERRVLAEALAGWGERYPDVKVVEQSEEGHPVDALRDASTRAGLLVVGSRGRGGLAGLVLGSVSHSMLHHAACPLVVVPPAGEAGRS